MNNKMLAALCALSLLAGCSAQVAQNQPSAGPQKDVFRDGDGIRLGSGWYPLEHYKNINFRWTTNDAEITACPNANNRTLTMMLEPGPGVGQRPFTLVIRGNHGDNITTTVHAGRYVKIAVNPGAPAETFLLHARSRNLPTPHDSRILNFRATDIILGSSAGDCKNEIVFDGSPLALGNNWYAYETFNGQSFRWVNNKAEIKLTKAQPSPFTLEAEVEEGPSLGGSPLRIAIMDTAGKTLAKSSVIRGASYVDFHLPAQPAGATLVMSVQSKNIKAAKEARILNFRVFGLKIKP